MTHKRGNTLAERAIDTIQMAGSGISVQYKSYVYGKSFPADDAAARQLYADDLASDLALLEEAIATLKGEYNLNRRQ